MYFNFSEQTYFNKCCFFCYYHEHSLPIHIVEKVHISYSFSSQPTSFDVNWVCWEATQFAMAATSQDE